MDDTFDVGAVVSADISNVTPFALNLLLVGSGDDDRAWGKLVEFADMTDDAGDDGDAEKIPAGARAPSYIESGLIAGGSLGWAASASSQPCTLSD